VRERVRHGRATLAALLAVCPLVLAGCGSSDDDASASAVWADGFCSALTTWKGDLESVGSTLKGGDALSKATIESAASAVSSANGTLGDDIEALGDAPDTGRTEAKNAVEDLRGQLAKSADEITAATQDVSSPADVLQAVNTTSAALLTMSSDISATVATLASIDAADEWKQAFADSEACKSLRNA